MNINKKTKILIIGFGSIGKRHYRNLLEIGYNKISIFDPDDKAFENFKNVKRIDNLKIEVVKNYYIALICSPNNLHIKHALICARAGCHLFIEKPLSNNFKGINSLLKICRENKLITMIGCNIRFHPCLNYIKKYLRENKLGRIYSIKHEFGYYLPYWRPGQNYSKNYAAKKSTGGGIILDDIHEFDLLFWLNNFNKVVDHKLIFNKVSSLKIQTEDQAVGTFLFKNKVIGLVLCNYLEQNYNRKCKIVGEKGSLDWDFGENIVWLRAKNGNKKLFESNKYNLNSMYINEIRYFFNCLNKKQPTFNDIKTAFEILKYCLEK